MLAIRTGLLQRAGGLFSILARALQEGSFIQSPLLKQTVSSLRRAVGSRDSRRTLRIKRGEVRACHTADQPGTSRTSGISERRSDTDETEPDATAQWLPRPMASAARRLTGRLPVGSHTIQVLVFGVEVASATVVAGPDRVYSFFAIGLADGTPELDILQVLDARHYH